MGVVLSSSSQTDNNNNNNNNSNNNTKNTKQDDFKKPRFYSGREGPSFQTLDFNKRYETRHVKTNLWVSTIVKGSFQEAVTQGVPKLRKYIKGQNQQKKFLNDTCPILMKKILQEHMEGKIVVSMMIPHEYLHRPPATNSPDVYIQEEPKHIYYASIYKKQFDADILPEEVYQTMEMMDKRGEQYEKGYYTLAVYDINVKQLGKVKYYEYWIYGEKMEKDYKSSRLSDDEEEQPVVSQHGNSGKNNKVNGSLSVSSSSKNKYKGASEGSDRAPGDRNRKNSPFIEGMMQQHMMKLEL